MKHFFLRLFGQFDHFGLKYPVSHLCAIADQIPFWPIEKQAKYADTICVRMVNENSEVLKSMITYHTEDFSYWNTTTVGNLAYVVKHGHIEDTIKVKCLRLLKEYAEYKKLTTNP